MKGEKLNAQNLSNCSADEEMFDHDGDYEEIFALDYKLEFNADLFLQELLSYIRLKSYKYYDDNNWFHFDIYKFSSEEKKNMRGLSRGYPPVTPINSMRDSIISSLCNKILDDISPHVVDLVLQCKSKQANLCEFN